MTRLSRFEVSSEQVARNAAGIARCRDVLDQLGGPEPSQPAPATRSEEIHQRAVERAVAERRSQRLVGVEHVSDLIEVASSAIRNRGATA